MLPNLDLNLMMVVEYLRQMIPTSVLNRWVVVDLDANLLVCGPIAASSSVPANSVILYMSFARHSCFSTMNLKTADLMSDPNLDDKPWVLKISRKSTMIANKICNACALAHTARQVQEFEDLILGASVRAFATLP